MRSYDCYKIQILNIKLDPLVQLLPHSHFLSCFLNSFMTATYFVLHSEEMKITIFPSENKYVSEHIPRMTSCEKISEGFWENSMKPRQGPCNLNFFKNMELFRDYAFVLLPGIADGSGFISLFITISYCCLFLCLHAKTWFGMCSLALWLYISSCDPSSPSKFKYSNAQNKINYCMRL